MSHAQLVSQLVSQLEALALQSIAREESSVSRLQHVQGVVAACEQLVQTQLLHLADACEVQHRCFSALQNLRRHLEDARVQLHAELSVTLLDPEFGLTEDVCFFVAWALCTCLTLALGQTLDLPVLDAATRKLFYVCDDDTATRTAPAYLWQGQAVETLSPAQLDIAYASIFQHCRTICWEHKQLPALTTALQVRAAQLLVQRSYPQLASFWLTESPPTASLTEESPDQLMQWCERRVLWSCGSARLKLAQMYTLTWKAHIEQQLLQGIPVPLGREVTAEQFHAYLQVTIKSWIGPRLRESLAKASNKRLLRPDEVGRNAAFEGNNKFCRARGGMDAMENALHSLDVVKLMTCPEDQLVLAARGLKELLVLRVVHNALESVTTCDLMGRHVVLQSLRDSRSSKGGTDVNLYVHKLLELPGGYAVTPHQPHYPSEPMLLEQALRLWYNTHFKGDDPLGIVQTTFLL